MNEGMRKDIFAMAETQGSRWKRVASVASIGGASGVAGWALENMHAHSRGEPWRFSAAFRGLPVPFLPVYAVGGATVAAVGPALRNSGLPWFLRGASYALLLGGLELAACKIDRMLAPGRRWDYDADAAIAAAATAEAALEQRRSRPPTSPSSSSSRLRSTATAASTSHTQIVWGLLGLIVEHFAVVEHRSAAASAQ